MNKRNLKIIIVLILFAWNPTLFADQCPDPASLTPTSSPGQAISTTTPGGIALQSAVLSFTLNELDKLEFVGASYLGNPNQLYCTYYYDVNIDPTDPNGKYPGFSMYTTSSPNIKPSWTGDACTEAIEDCTFTKEN